MHRKSSVSFNGPKNIAQTGGEGGLMTQGAASEASRW